MGLGYQLDRREMLLSNALLIAGLCGFTAGQQESLSGGLGSAQTNEDIITEISALIDNPYISAASGVAGVIGAVSTAEWQRQTSRQLRAIRRQLRVIEAKIDQILSVLERLPGIIRRELRAQRMNEIMNQIRARRGSIEGVLSKYDSVDGDVSALLTPLDRQAIALSALSTIELSYEMQSWGDDSFFTLGESFCTALIARNLLGEEIQSISYLKERFLPSIRNSWQRLFNSSQDLRA